MGWRQTITRQLAPKVTDLAPGLTTTFVQEALNRAIQGVGPLPGAAAAAEAHLRGQRGDVDRAVHELIENHVRYAGAQGFLTNLGGLVTAAVTIPANIVGLTLVQCRMVAAIAHLRGYELDDPRVRNAVMACVIGEEEVSELVRNRQIPAPPMALATAPAHDPEADRMLAATVARMIIARFTGKRFAVVVGRRIPVVGGLIGMGADGYGTWRIGRYADRELLPRTKR